MALIVITLGIIITINFSRMLVSNHENEKKKQAEDRAALRATDVFTTEAIRKGSTQGLAEEALLAPEGVGGG
jgi:hypothetical protein